MAETSTSDTSSSGVVNYIGIVLTLAIVLSFVIFLSRTFKLLKVLLFKIRITIKNVERTHIAPFNSRTFYNVDTVYKSEIVRSRDYSFRNILRYVLKRYNYVAYYVLFGRQEKDTEAINLLKPSQEFYLLTYVGALFVLWTLANFFAALFLSESLTFAQAVGFSFLVGLLSSGAICTLLYYLHNLYSNSILRTFNSAQEERENGRIFDFLSQDFKEEKEEVVTVTKPPDISFHAPTQTPSPGPPKLSTYNYRKSPMRATLASRPDSEDVSVPSGSFISPRETSTRFLLHH